MTRTFRLWAVILLVGLVLLIGLNLVIGLEPASQPSEVLVENTRWSHGGGFDETTKQPVLYAHSFQLSGDDFDGGIIFRCIGTDFVSNFSVSVKIRDEDFYVAERNEVFWRIDSGAEPKTVWQRRDDSWGGLRLVGPRALELAFEMLRARKQVQITTDNGLIVNDLTNYKDALARMLKRCLTN